MNFKSQVIYFLLISGQASAFSVFPEYHSLNETEQSTFQRPNQIDSEFASDQLAYWPDARWHAAFLSSARVFDGSAGSLSGNTFLLHTRGKFVTDPSEKVQFRFIAFQERDFDTDQVRQIAEMNYRLLDRLRVGAYGEPSMLKRENDVGVSLTYDLAPGEEVRAFRTLVDLVRNERNDNDDRFQVAPTSTGLTWRGARRGKSEMESSFFHDFVDMTVRWDTFTSWRFPSQNYTYGFEQIFAQARRRQFYAGDKAWHVSAQWNDHRENRNVDSGSGSESWRQQRLMLVAQWEKYWSSRSSLRPGVGWIQRSWEGTHGVRVSHMNVMPHVWWQLGSWQLGYETTWFRASGPTSLRGPGSPNQNFEHRLNVRYDIALTEKSMLSLMLTFDLDNFAAAGFEGGNGQIRAEF